MKKISLEKAQKRLKNGLSELGFQITKEQSLFLLGRVQGFRTAKEFVYFLETGEKKEIDEKVPTKRTPTKLMFNGEKYTRNSLVKQVIKTSQDNYYPSIAETKPSIKRKEYTSSIDSILDTLNHNYFLSNIDNRKLFARKTLTPFSLELGYIDYFTFDEECKKEVIVCSMDGGLKNGIVSEILSDFYAHLHLAEKFTNSISVSSKDNVFADQLTSLKISSKIADTNIKITLNVDVRGYFVTIKNGKQLLVESGQEMDFNLFEEALRILDGKSSKYYKQYSDFLRANNKKLIYFNTSGDELFSKSDADSGFIDAARIRFLLLLIDERQPGVLKSLISTFEDMVSVVHNEDYSNLALSGRCVLLSDDDSDFKFTVHVVKESIVYDFKLLNTFLEPFNV